MPIRLAYAMPVLLTMPAMAQDRPPVVMPTRDVVVTYQLADGRSMHLSWLANTRKMRMEDPPGLPGPLLVDHRTHKATLLIEAQRISVEVPIDVSIPGAAVAAPENAMSAITGKEGEGIIAGRPCTIWRYNSAGQSGSLCLTEDGITLRAESDHRPESRVEATAVDYVAQDAARFTPPADFRVMTLQAMQGFNRR